MWRLACAMWIPLACSPPLAEPALAPQPPAPEAPAEPTPPGEAAEDVPAPAGEAPLPSFHARFGTLDSAQVGALIESNAKRFRDCGLHGTALVRVVVGTGGKVESAAYDRESLAGGDKACPLDVLRSLDFPAPSGGSAELVVPLVFRAKAP